MKTTKKAPAWKEWHGFAIEIGPDTDLCGTGLLVLEYEDGGYEPLAQVATVNEAQEIAADRMRANGSVVAYDARTKGAFEDRGGFKLWARGLTGRYLTVPVVIDGKRK